MLYLRSLIFNICCYSTLTVGCIFNSLVGIFSKDATIKIWNYFFIPLLVQELKYIAGITIEIRGHQYMQQSNAIYASKHQSALETYILSNYLKTASFILKKELTYVPIFGWAQSFYGMIAVDRSAGGATLKRMLKDVKERLKKGRPVIIFPEGTRTKPEMTTQYKPGLVFLYQNIDAPVIPVALNTGFFWAKKSFLRRPGKVIFEFMEPMPKGLEKKEFMEKLQARIEAKCVELNAETVKNYPEVGYHLQSGKKA